jgi:hypothetical protein
LQSYNAKATFFVTGRNLGKGAINDGSTPWPALIRRMIADGHQIASHTWSHQRLTTLSRSKFLNQMHYLETALSDLLGYFPTYMRPPYSASNDTVDAWLGELGYHVTYFNLDTEGYLHDDAISIQQSKDIWDANVEGRTPSLNKWLQIEHDPVFQSVYNLTGYMLESLFRNGFRSVTVGECLLDPEENWYRSASGGDSGGQQTGPSTTRSATRTASTTSTSTRSATRTASTTSTSTRSATRTASTTSTSASTNTLLPISTNGRCGPNFNGTTCIREPGATCCSLYGWCGATGDHCGTGCQSRFGTCGTSN